MNYCRFNDTIIVPKNLELYCDTKKKEFNELNQENLSLREKIKIIKQTNIILNQEAIKLEKEGYEVFMDITKDLEIRCNILRNQNYKMAEAFKIFEKECLIAKSYDQKIQILSNEVKIECRICMEEQCNSILFCGHFICDKCIKNINITTADDMVTCPWCKQVCQYHKIYL